MPLKTPKEDIAKNEVILVQDAQVKIKEIIVRGVTNGDSKIQVEKLVGEVIKDTVSKTELDKQLVQRSLTTLAKNSYWQTNKNIALLKKNLVKDLKKIEPSYQVGVGFDIATLEQSFRPYLDTAPKGLAVIQDYRKKVQSEMNALASDPAMVTNNGEKYSARNYAEMTVRYEANMKDLERLKDGDEDLVWTSSHADSSIRCEVWQGRLYSIKGRTGTIDGNSYTPLSEALAGTKGDGNSIINGYNCRHRLIEYTGQRPPVEYDEATIRKQREIDQRQRQYENRIRQLKVSEKLNRATGDKTKASELRKRWQSLNKNYQAYSLRNGRAYYQWRTVVDAIELE